MGFIYKSPGSANDLEQGSVDSELNALYSSLDEQKEQLEQQHELQQHDSQQEQQQQQLQIVRLQDQIQDLQGKQQQLQEQQKAQRWWEIPIKYDPKGFWDVRLSDVGGYFMMLLIVVLIATLVLGLVFRDWGIGGSEIGAVTVTATAMGVSMASPTVAGMAGT